MVDSRTTRDLDLNHLLNVAREAARAGGDVLRANREHVGGVREKSAAVDVVTESDIASGVAVVRSLLLAETGATFIVEEDEVYGETGAPKADDAGRGLVWMIDPLDGTTSYLHGYPCYSVSVALLLDGVVQVGAVYNAATDEMFSATRGDGAWHDTTPLRCSDVREMPRALLVSGFPYDRGEPLQRQLRILSKMIATAHDIRRDGSAAIDCCHVAGTRCDGYWELGLRPWDLAAGILIAEEAGARVTDFTGGAWTPETSEIVIANPSLHEVLLGIIADAEANRA